ncbi:hypothetical protein ACP70R_028409 [Stipagrostis hirtigluma subsp. patula]
MSSRMGTGVHHHCILLLIAFLGLGILLAAPATAREVPVAVAAGHYRMMTDVSIQREVPTGSNRLHNQVNPPTHDAMQTADVSIQHQVPKGKGDPIHNETPSPYDVVKTDVSIQHKVPVGKGDPIHNQGTLSP